MNQSVITNDERDNIRDANYKDANRVTRVGTFFDFVLTIGKLVVGIMAGSAALVAEGVHSLADLLFDFVVLVGMYFARVKPDESHPYGHGKFESLSTLILSILLLLLAGGLMIDAVERVQKPNLEPPEMMAFWVAVISMITKELLYQYTVTVGRKIQSKIIIANAWHHRADSISLAAAMIGIGGAVFGWPILDPLAAIAVAFFVGKVGVDIAHGSLRELTDASTAVDEQIREHIARLVTDNQEVRSAHLLKSRRLGPDIIVDVHVVVDPYLTVSEGHQIADRIQVELFNAIESISEVMVHVDTVNDQFETVLPHYPDREQLKMRIEAYMEEKLPLLAARLTIDKLQPHYQPRGITLDLFILPTNELSLNELHKNALVLSEALLSAFDDFQEIHTHLRLLSVETALP